MILPKEQSRWLVAQPDNILNSRKVINTKFAIDYLIPHIRQELELGMSLAIRRDLTRNLGRTQKTSFNAIRALVDQLMGFNHNTYTELNLVGVLGPVISGVSNRMLVGDALYNNEAFMKSLAAFGNIMGLSSLVIGQYAPFFVRPVIGSVASVLVRVFRRRALKFMVPAARERMNDIRRKKENPGREYEAPLDIMQWVILACPDASAEEIAALILSLVGVFFPCIFLVTFATRLFILLLFFFCFVIRPSLQSDLSNRGFEWCFLYCSFPQSQISSPTVKQEKNEFGKSLHLTAQQL